MCDKDRQYTHNPRYDDRITQLKEMILEQKEIALRQNNKIEILEDKLADKIDIFHIGENVKYKKDIVSITDIQIEDDNIEYYTIKLKEGLERQVFKKDLTKININIETLQQKTNVQKFVFHIINNINRYYFGPGDDATYNNIGCLDWGYRHSSGGPGVVPIDGPRMAKTNHLHIYHWDYTKNTITANCPIDTHRFIIYGAQSVEIYHNFNIPSGNRTIENDFIEKGITELPEGIKICSWFELCNILGIIKDKCIPYNKVLHKDTPNIARHIKYMERLNMNELLFYYHPDYLHIDAISVYHDIDLQNRLNPDSIQPTQKSRQSHQKTIEQVIHEYHGIASNTNTRIFNETSNLLIKPKKDPNEIRYYTDILA